MNAARNLVEVFEAQARSQGSRAAVKHKRDGRWQEILALPTDPQAFEAFWA